MRPNPTRMAVPESPVAFWAGIVAVACALGLLFAFQQVVHKGKEQAEIRNQAAIANADAAWRCIYSAAMQREGCRAASNASADNALSAGTKPDGRAELVSMADQ